MKTGGLLMQQKPSQNATDNAEPSRKLNKAVYARNRTIQEYCELLPAVRDRFYPLRTTTVFVFFTNGPGLCPRRCRRVAAKSNDDEHATRARGGTLEMFMSSKNSRRAATPRPKLAGTWVSAKQNYTNCWPTAYFRADGSIADLCS
jgi:hypothetical protein